MKIIKWIMPYRCDYNEICDFKKSFDTYKNVTKLRRSIYNWLDKKTNEQILDVELKLKVEIEEINKNTICSSAIPLVTFFLGSVSSMAQKTSESFIFYILGIAVIAIIYSLYIRKCLSHYKYYVFLDEIIKRYKKSKGID